MATYKITVAPFRVLRDLLNGCDDISVIHADVGEDGDGELLIAVKPIRVASFFGLLFNANTNPQALRLSVREEFRPAWPGSKIFLISWCPRVNVFPATSNTFYYEIIDGMEKDFFKKAA